MTWSLVGIPDHQGVMNVGGRLGAASGPAAFRRAWARLSSLENPSKSLEDFGDVSPIAIDVAMNHKTASRLIAKAHQKCGISVVVGGGHDHGHSHLVGVLQSFSSQKKKPRLGCINIDAHLDVRKPEPEISSGSPFYLAVESATIDASRLIEFGIQRQCNAPVLWEYVQQKKIPVVLFESLRGGKAVASFRAQLAKLSRTCDAIVISLDLDAFAHGSAPGVSAPQPEGFTPSEVFEMLRLAGLSKKTISLGIFELNPEHDRDEQTAKLAANCAFHFIESVLRRT